MKLQSFATLVSLALAAIPHAAAQGQTLYSHGNPTADEQYMLELINRARANPVAEAQRLLTSDDVGVNFALSYYKVDQARLRREFASYSVQPPLAMSSRLLAAARRHSNDMAKNNFQSHVGSDRSSISDRIGDAGYKGSFLSENVYSNLVSNTFFAHAGLNIDWGPGAGGVQQGVGHRVNIMGLSRAGYREVGIAVAARSGANAEKYGKLAITQNFGIEDTATWFLLGIAYNDKNGNGICDPGEGLSDIRVQPSVGTHYAVTSSSGGYAVPFAQSPGDATVTFSGGGLAKAETRAFSLVRQNVKVDLRTVPGAPPLAVSINKIDSLASERGKGGTALFRIVRSGPTTTDLKVAVTRPIIKKPGSALPADYKLSAVKPARMKAPGKKGKTFEVTIPKGRAYAEIKITAVKDKLKEPTEKVKFTLSKTSAYQLSGTKAVTISIKD